MRWQEAMTPEHGVRLHVRRVVDPPAPPVVLLHGLGVGGAVWQAFARRLLPRFAAIAPDLRGHGQSDAPFEGYQPSDYASDLPPLLQALSTPTPLPVVGHSLGAMVAAALAQANAHLVDRLVLLDPPLDRGLRNPDVPSVFRLRKAPAGELEAYLLDRNPGGGQLLAGVLANLFRRASDQAFEALRDGPPPLDPSSLHVPCLVIQADPEHGGVLGDQAARAFVDALPDGRLIKIDGAPHAVHASHPAEVAEALLTFL
jgi:pimeloyl-ACP methyl ester carboxylesterase